MKVLTLAAALLLTGCVGNSLKPTDMDRDETRQAQQVRQGTVIDVYVITIKGNTGVAQGVGAGIGGYAANRAAKDSSELTQVAATAAGAIVGSVVGNSVSDLALDKPGVNLVIQTDQGGTVAVSQQADSRVSFAPGDRVWLIGDNNTLRVVPQ
jgi:outer membrane lipoprotein SlyB